MEIDPAFRNQINKEINAELGEKILEELLEAPEAGAVQMDNKDEAVVELEAEVAEDPSEERSVAQSEAEASPTPEVCAEEAEAEDEPYLEAFKRANTLMDKFYAEVEAGKHAHLTDGELQSRCEERKAAAFREALGEDQDLDTSEDDDIQRFHSIFEVTHKRKLEDAKSRRYKRKLRDDFSRNPEEDYLFYFDATWTKCETLEDVKGMMEELEEHSVYYDPLNLEVMKYLGTSEQRFKSLVAETTAAKIFAWVSQIRRIKNEVSTILETKKYIEVADLKLKARERELYQVVRATSWAGGHHPVVTIMKEVKEESKKKMAAKRSSEEAHYTIAVDYACDKFKEILQDSDRNPEELYAIVSRSFVKAASILEYAEKLWQWPSECPDHLKEYFPEKQGKAKPKTSEQWDQELKDCTPEAIAQLEASLLRLRQNTKAPTTATKTKKKK